MSNFGYGDNEKYLESLRKELQAHGLALKIDLYLKADPANNGVKLIQGFFEDPDRLWPEVFTLTLFPAYKAVKDCRIMILKIKEKDLEVEIPLIEKFSKFFGAAPLFRYRKYAEGGYVYYQWDRIPISAFVISGDYSHCLDFRFYDYNLFDLFVLFRKFDLSVCWLERYETRQDDLVRSEPPGPLGKKMLAIAAKELDFWVRGEAAGEEFFFSIEPRGEDGDFGDIYLYFTASDGLGLIEKFDLLFCAKDFVGYQYRGSPEAHYYQWAVNLETIIEVLLEDGTICNRRSSKEIKAELRKREK